jgi:MoaD family protein
MIRIRFFARLREITGREEWELDEGGSLHDILEKIKKEFPKLAQWIDQGNVLISVNQEIADHQKPIQDGDEIGLMPPFSGGSEPVSAANAVRVQHDGIDLQDEIRQIKAVSRRIGAVVTFLGTVRDFSDGRDIQAIYFEHYPAMAEKYLQNLRQQMLNDFNLIDVRILHRIGKIPAGEDIVCVIVASEHRGDAFEACRWSIDELKRTVPLWKKEMTPVGEVWVDRTLK